MKIVVSQTRDLSICHMANIVNANMYNTWVFRFEQATLEADNAKYEQKSMTL